MRRGSVLLVCVLSFSAVASSVRAEEPNTAVIYANGVFVSYQDAEDSVNALVERLALTPGLEFHLAYNQTGCPEDGINGFGFGCLRDLFEAVLLDLETDISQFYRFIARSVPLPDFFQDALEEGAAVFDAGLLTNDDIRIHLELYSTKFLQGKKVVIVAHSQGNFFGNKAFGLISEDQEDSFGIVSAANPDSFVAGDDRLFFDDHHTTLIEDFVIECLIFNCVTGAQLFNPMLPNVTNLALGINFGDLSGHQFIKSYLRSGGDSETKILADILDVKDLLVQPPIVGESPSAFFAVDSNEPGFRSIIKIGLDGSVSVAVTNAEIAAAVGTSSFDLVERGVAVDSAGNIFFTTDRVFLGGPSVQFVLVKPAGGGPVQVVATDPDVGDPEGILVAPDGTLYVVDDASDSIVKITDPLGTPVVSVLATESEFLALPGITFVDLHGGIAISADGATLYVASDGNPDAVFKIDIAMETVSLLSNDPVFSDLDVFMTVAPNGDVIVADDSGAQTIYRITPDGTVSEFLSAAEIDGVVPGVVDLEGGIAFDADGNFYITERNTDSIYKWDVLNKSEGTINTASGALFVSEAAIAAANGGIGNNPNLESGLTFALLPEPEVQYLSTLQGNPGVPGDGVIVSSIGSFPEGFFQSNPPFSLVGITNGITVTVFPETTNPETVVGFLEVQVFFPDPPCSGFIAPLGFNTSVGPVINNVLSYFTNVSQVLLENIVSAARTAFPGPCGGVTVNDLAVRGVILFDSSTRTVTFTDLDALAVGFGENVFPTADTPVP